jgi:hypothetical protein
VNAQANPQHREIPKDERAQARGISQSARQCNQVRKKIRAEESGSPIQIQ